MNVFFIIDGVLTTPSLDGTILPGITRDSILQLARDKGMPTAERKVSVEEVLAAAKAGKLNAAFGAGTAATIAPIQAIGHAGGVIDLPEPGADSEVMKIGAMLDDIRRGRAEDKHGWMVRAS